MSIEHHTLVKEFPEFKEQIHTLKMENRHFAKLFGEYDEVDHEIIRIEEGVENTSDEYLESLKMKRLTLKDEIYSMLKAEAA